MTSRIVFSALMVLIAGGCSLRTANARSVEMRFYETPEDAPAAERLNQRLTLNAALISDAALHFKRPSELLKAAETSAGGDPQKLMRAARTLAVGQGVVFLGTVRAPEASGGAKAVQALYSVALGCEPSNLDAPGDLKGCKGYLMRVTRQWPAEVYGLEDATLSLIPDGGTAHGRLKAKSTPGAFKAEIEGEFTASVVQLTW
jgi:hypothetical protein